MKALRFMVTLAAALAFVLAGLGTWVRIENARRLMCTDWPLCRGSLVPPLEGAMALEWAHRVLTSVEGALIVAVVLLAWPRRHAIAGLQAALFALVSLFAVEVALGGLTVLTAVSPLSAVAHWAVAMSLLATLVGLAIVLHVAAPQARGNQTSLQLAASAALAFAAMSIGSYVSASYAGLTCTGFPGCNGSFTGQTLPQAIGMLHRLVAGSFVVVAALSTIAVRKSGSLNAKRVATLGIALAGAQACLGVATVRLGDPLWAREAHATVAGLTFLVFSAAAVFAALEPRAAARSAVTPAAPAAVPA